MTISILSAPAEDGDDVLALNTRFLPLTVWDEHRPNGEARVICDIAEGSNGELMFESDGSVMTDPIYWRRPWEKLVGFRPLPAKELYFSGIDTRAQQEFMKHLALTRIFMPNDAIVMVADVADDFPSLPMHLNYGVGTQVEIMQLHATLLRRFISLRQQIVDTVCNGEFKWLSEEEVAGSAMFAERAAKFVRATAQREKQIRRWGWMHSTQYYEEEILKKAKKYSWKR